MRIFHIVTGLTKANGVSVFVCELAAEQTKLGHEVSICVRELGVDQYPVSSQVKILCGDAQISGQFKQFDHSGDNIVHLHGLWSPRLTTMAKRARAVGAKVVWSPHGMLTPWALKHKWWKKLAGLLLYQWVALRRADLIHVTAQAEMQDVRRLGLRNKCIIAPLGARVEDALKFEKTGKCKRDERSHKTILFVSRIQKKKGLPVLLEAWARCVQEGVVQNSKDRWKIRIVGPDQEGHTEELRRLAKQLNISGDIEFVGPRYGVELEAEYSRADIFVLPSHSENFGSVVVEALAAGLPVITTTGTPWKDLKDYRCGWWVKLSVDSLGMALASALRLSDEDRAQMGDNGKRLVAEKYTWAAAAEAMIAGYEQILESKRA